MPQSFYPELSSPYTLFLAGGLTPRPPRPPVPLSTLVRTHFHVASQTTDTAPETREASTSVMVTDRLVALRYARQHGFYLGRFDLQESTYWGHYLACLRLPRGGVNAGGSQECSFEYEAPAPSVLSQLVGGLPYRERQVWSGRDGWISSATIDTYYAFDRHAVDHYLRLHARKCLGESASLYRGSRLVAASSQQRPSSLISACPPLLIEVCHRSRQRTVAVVSFKLIVLSDLGAISMPPRFEFAQGMDHLFRLRALNHLEAMRERGAKLTSGFEQLLQSESLETMSDSEASQSVVSSTDLGWPESPPHGVDSDSASNAEMDSDFECEEEMHRRDAHTSVFPRVAHSRAQPEATTVEAGVQCP